ncbi:unnamed protein product [Rotaria sp. Silwood2]|nr:unnamed protein product [Rotaria sp. Silwood2]
MALALLFSPEQLKNNNEDMNDVLDQLLQHTIDAANNQRFRDTTGFHVSEPLAVMVKLFVVDERTLDYILCNAKTDPPSDISSTISQLSWLLVVFYNAREKNDQLTQITLIAIMNILWSISFQAQYRPYLSNDNKLAMFIITDLAKGDYEESTHWYKPRSMESIRNAARGILDNLGKTTDGIDREIDDSSNRISTAKTDANPIVKSSIMISYCHENKEFCGKLLELLSTYSDKFDVWIDQNHCQSASDLWESIAIGMEEAQIIVCLVSNHYFQSKSCRRELTYAVETLKKPVVPVLLESIEPKGWLGIRISGVKYVRFKDIKQLNQTKTDDLLNTILESLKSSQNLAENPPVIRPIFKKMLADEPAPISRKNSIGNTTLLPLDKWSSATIDDIKQWFSHHHISVKLQDLYNFQTGQEMLQYAQMLITIHLRFSGNNIGMRHCLLSSVSLPNGSKQISFFFKVTAC